MTLGAYKPVQVLPFLLPGGHSSHPRGHPREWAPANCAVLSSEHLRDILK